MTWLCVYIIVYMCCRQRRQAAAIQTNPMNRSVSMIYLNRPVVSLCTVMFVSWYLLDCPGFVNLLLLLLRHCLAILFLHQQLMFDVRSGLKPLLHRSYLQQGSCGPRYTMLRCCFLFVSK